MPTSVVAADVAEKESSIPVWTLAIYGHEMTARTYRDFYAELSKRHGLSFDYHYGKPASAPFRDCDSQRYSLLLTGLTPGIIEGIRSCKYSVLAYTEQPVYLVTRSELKLEQIRKIGVVSGSSTARAALLELGDMPMDSDIQLMATHTDLMMALISGGIDALVTADFGLSQMSRPARAQTRIAHVFERPIVAVFVADNTLLESEVGQKIRASILENGVSSRQVFVDKMKFGLWQAEPSETILRAIGSGYASQ